MNKVELRSFKDLADEEKNRVWWEIASVATLFQGERITYTLAINQAIRISRYYRTTVLEVFNLFREGATAEWRFAEPLEKGQEEDESWLRSTMIECLFRGTFKTR